MKDMFYVASIQKYWLNFCFEILLIELRDLNEYP